MENEGRSVADAIGRFVTERTRSLTLFAEQNRDLLSRFLASNEDPELQQQLNILIGKHFPNYLAFTLRGVRNQLVPDDFGELVGPVCRNDIDNFWQSQEHRELSETSNYKPFIHPQGGNYHFDMMTLWQTSNGEKAILFVSFLPTQLTRIISSFQLPGHHVVLVRNDQKDLIELTAQGARDILKANIRLSPEELQRVFHSLPIEHTRWIALVLPQAGFLEEQEWKIHRRAGVQVLGIVLFWVGAMWLMVRTLRQREQAYITINEQAERLLRSQQVAHVGSWDWNILTGGLEWTDEIYSIFGRSRDDFGSTYENFLQCIHPDDREKVISAVGNAVANGAPYDLQHRVLLPSGDVRYVQEKGQVYRDHMGQPVRMLGIVHDVTDRIMLDKSKNEFISTVSHELRTPLTSIKGSLSLLLGGAAGDLPKKMKDMIVIAHNNADRLINLVSDILDLEKLQSERLEFNLRDLDVGTLLMEGVNANLGYAHKLGVTFTIQHPLPGQLVRCDKDRILQVLTNLLSNAAKFSPRNSTVTVSAIQAGDRIKISVTDQGAGISKEFQSRIFERFSQEDSSDQRTQGGTGLGLSICKNIVEKHGGEIGFDSTLGQGSTFFFTLPIATDERQP
ncbi:sensor histidine kinase [Magnetovibrio sp.]|uniref:sensor histidine kinase n=1 Tax=Magnetovibrio sp. TaxID=2024836 RepID=UPI002F92D65B